MKYHVSWKADNGSILSREFVSLFIANEFMITLKRYYGFDNVCLKEDKLPESTIVLNRIRSSYISMGMKPEIAERRIRQMITTR